MLRYVIALNVGAYTIRYNFRGVGRSTGSGSWLGGGNEREDIRSVRFVFDCSIPLPTHRLSNLPSRQLIDPSNLFFLLVTVMDQ